MARYPGAALVTHILSWASRHGLHPEDVYEDYRLRARGYQLMWAWEGHVAEEERKSSERLNKGRR